MKKILAFTQDFLHDLARRARRRHEAVPGGDVEAGQGLGDRRHIRQRLGPFGAGDGERFQLPAFGELDWKP